MQMERARSMQISEEVNSAVLFVLHIIIHLKSSCYKVHIINSVYFVYSTYFVIFYFLYIFAKRKQTLKN